MLVGAIASAGFMPGLIERKAGFGDDDDVLGEIKALLDDQGKAWLAHKQKSDQRIDELARAVDELLLKSTRPAMGGPAARSGCDPDGLKALDLGFRALVAGDNVKANGHFAEAKAMSAGSDPDGGYVVHPMVSSGMTTVMEEISPVYRLARRITMTQGDAFEEPVDRDTADSNWVGETTTRSETDTPDLGLMRIELNEISAMPKVTQKLIDTASINITAWLTGKVGTSFAIKEGTAFHTGDGVAKPRGFLAYPTTTAGDASRAWGQIQHIGTGASAAFPTSSTSVNPADVLVDVVGAMKAQYRAGAVWLMNRATAGVVRKLKDAEGRHVWVDSLAQGQPSQLLGFPVEIDESMPDIAANSYSIAFINPQKAYTIIEYAGARFLADPYSAKPHVLLYAYRRVGGGVSNFEAVKLLKFI